MTSISTVHPEEGSSTLSPEGFGPLLPYKVFSIFWELFLIRCEVKGQGCRTCADCKAL